MDEQAIREAIQTFIANHRARPFAVLREIAVQAELKRLVNERLDVGSIDAELVTHPGGQAYLPNPTVNTDRVRLEAKILLPGDGESKMDTRHDRTDMILYRELGVRLYRHPNGAGDVVYRARPEDVMAAVEIKASPSRALEQKKSYARDIQRLLRLKRSYSIAGFFVVLDKSSPRYQPDFPPISCIDWAAEANQARCLTNIVYEGHPQAAIGETWGDIFVSNLLPKDAVDYIEVFDVSATDDRPSRLFAYFGDNIGPTHDADSETSDPDYPAGDAQLPRLLHKVLAVADVLPEAPKLDTPAVLGLVSEEPRHETGRTGGAGQSNGGVKAGPPAEE